MVENPSKQGLPCPVCRVDLVMSDRQGVEIDYCPQCRGVWLDRGELDKIIERASPMTPPVTLREPDRARQPEPRRDDDDDYRGGYKKKRRESFLGELFDF